MNCCNPNCPNVETEQYHNADLHVVVAGKDRVVEEGSYTGVSACTIPCLAASVEAYGSYILDHRPRKKNESA